MREKAITMPPLRAIAPPESRARARPTSGVFIAIREAHNFSDLGACSLERRCIRRPELDRAVILVEHQVFRLRQHRLRSQQCDKFADQLWLQLEYFDGSQFHYSPRL